MKSFSSSTLHKGIVDVLADKGIIIPSEIQAKTIPVLLEHNGDFVGRSATGTGKTFAFGAPLLTKVNPSVGKVQAVVLVPTRELCEQVGTELIELGAKVPGLKTEAIYGGMSMKTQINSLSNGVQVIVATPGRLMDLIQRKIVDLSALEYVVFDEADEMLLKGFRTDIDKILDKSSRKFSTWLFSATMPDDINGIIKKYLTKDLIRVNVGDGQKTNAGILHQYIEVNPEEKSDVLLHFLHSFGESRIIIFCRTKSGVQKLYKQLSAAKFSSGAVHGDLPQGLRNKVMEQFKSGSINILIATDVAARGVDVEDVAYVVQYHLPDVADAYTHRSGRTSRAGKTGISLTFVFQEEKEKLMEIKEALNIKLEQVSAPSAKDQLLNKAVLWAHKVSKEKPVSAEKIDGFTREQFKQELLHLTKDELLEKLLATYLREQQG